MTRPTTPSSRGPLALQIPSECSETKPPERPSATAACMPGLRGRLVTLAGAAGAAVIGGGEAAAVTYTPTAGVAAAQGIPGFSFVDATNVTLGSLRPPAANGTIGWDVDGTGGDDFQLTKFATFQARLTAVNGGQWIVGGSASAQGILNAATGFSVSSNLSQGRNFSAGPVIVTSSSGNFQPSFTANVSGQFGFRFTNASDTHYGWASLLIDETPMGQGYKITEAYYNTTPGAAINVGAVPVPEPSSMALLGLGAAGVAAWRARRKTTPSAEAAAEVQA
jgi:hypothetical protein